MKCLLLVILLAAFMLLEDCSAQGETVVKGANDIETYFVHFWGTQDSARRKPTFSVARINNGPLEVRHCIRPGTWGDYTLPYWPIRGFLSIVNRPAEVALLGDAKFVSAGKSRAARFAVHEGFDLATVEGADVLRVANRGGDDPLLVEFHIVVARGDATVQVLARVVNTTKQAIKNVALEATHEQRFNWSDFGVANDDAYERAKAPSGGIASAFFAFSSGMQRGYEFVRGEDCELSYELSESMNRWRVVLSNRAVELSPGASASFRYIVRAVRSVPKHPAKVKATPTKTLLGLTYRKVRPTVFKSSPIKQEGRVMLAQLIRNLAQPKIRGLNLRAGFPQALEDLETLKDWGCNLVIVGISGKPEQTRRLIERGHELGMEVFIQGHGNFHSGSPRFDSLYTKPLPRKRQADSHGQDEDHVYWYGVKPTRDFEADFGKPMAQATQEERVAYWGRCFADKWKGVLETVRKHAPRGGVWFYDPSPWPAHLEPLDYYDVFFREIAELGDALTVFPFYYGVDFDNCEYMMRRWKDAGIGRAAFLPMRGFMARPSQFFRAITAARRGRSDGVCGFSFPVGAETPENAWQWKSVMLAAQANFPTSELNAYCFIEAPADLVEGLAASDVGVISNGVNVAPFLKRLNELLPGKARAIQTEPKEPAANELYVVIGGPEALRERNWPYDILREDPGAGKGIVQMSGKTVSLCGTDATGVRNAMTLLERFAELARAERGK